jgi:single-strand DNA-binding protein
MSHLRDIVMVRTTKLEDVMNYGLIAGHLGADPEVRFTSSGKKVTTLRVAARCRRKKEKTIWWQVSVWENEQHDKMISYLKKGSPVFVMGEINEPEIFTGRSGNPGVSMSMTASDLSFSPFGRPDGEKSATPESTSHAAPSATHAEPVTHGESKAPSFADEEVPF